MVVNSRVAGRIPPGEVTFHPHSFGDPAGRLFWWNGGLYRGISYEKTAFYRQLFQNDIIQRLIERGILIESKPTGLTLDGYGMVVHHRCIPFASYPHEWCAAMFRDAALAYLDLSSELVREGLSLKDTHPWNILFDGCRPVYVDFTSIQSLAAGSLHPPYDKFRRYYLYPLMLMAQGKERIARCLIPEYEGVGESEVLMLTSDNGVCEQLGTKLRRMMTALRAKTPQSARRRLKTIKSLFGKTDTVVSSGLDYIRHLRVQVEKIRLSSEFLMYSSPDRRSAAAYSIPVLTAAKQQCLQRILSELKPTSVLDIKAGDGWCSKLANSLGSQVVSFEPNPVRTTGIYEYARARQLKILPLIMDFTDPTPSRGISGHSSIAATDRLRCDLVLAMGLLPGIVLRKKLNFEQIVEGVAIFSNRWVILEFSLVDQDNVYPSEPQKFPWYTLENLTNTLRKRFRAVDARHLDGDCNVFLVCEN